MRVVKNFDLRLGFRVFMTLALISAKVRAELQSEVAVQHWVGNQGSRATSKLPKDHSS